MRQVTSWRRLWRACRASRFTGEHVNEGGCSLEEYGGASDSRRSSVNFEDNDPEGFEIYENSEYPVNGKGECDGEQREKYVPKEEIY